MRLRVAECETTADGAVRRDLRRFGVEWLCLLLLLQGFPVLALAEKREAARVPIQVERDTPPRREAAVSTEHRSVSASPPWIFFAESGRRLAAWLNEAEEPIELAQASGHAPLPSRLMAPLFAVAAGQTGHSGPPSPPGDRPAREPALPSELASLLEKAALEEIPFLPGFNLISIPEEPADPDPAAVFAPIAGQFATVAAYDACDTTDPWKLYDPADPAASDLTAATIPLWEMIPTAPGSEGEFLLRVGRFGFSRVE